MFLADERVSPLFVTSDFWPSAASGLSSHTLSSQTFVSSPCVVYRHRHVTAGKFIKIHQIHWDCCLVDYDGFGLIIDIFLITPLSLGFGPAVKVLVSERCKLINAAKKKKKQTKVSSASTLNFLSQVHTCVTVSDIFFTIKEKKIKH